MLFDGKPFKFQRPYGSYVMENVLFKIAFPAEFHAQTAVECAVVLHPLVKERFDDIKEIELVTHESAIRIISKQGQLHNPADRDHCLQYMVAVGLLLGDLRAEHYEDETARDARIDALRDKMHVTENPQFSADYHDPAKRSIANSLRIHFNDGSQSELITVEYPIGHQRRRAEGIPILLEKFEHHLKTQFQTTQVAAITSAMNDTNALMVMSVIDFVDLWRA